MQLPDPSKMAEQLFSKLDIKEQGYLEKSDLQAAFGNLSKSDNSNSTSNSTAIDDMFSKLDGDGDGKVTKAEMSATLEKLPRNWMGHFRQCGCKEVKVCRLPHHLKEIRTIRALAKMNMQPANMNACFRSAMASVICGKLNNKLEWQLMPA